jgi:PHP family Zn ribbon phosphoesterase
MRLTTSYLISQQNEVLSQDLHIHSHFPHQTSLKAIVVKVIHMRDEGSGALRILRRVEAGDVHSFRFLIRITRFREAKFTAGGSRRWRIVLFHKCEFQIDVSWVSIPTPECVQSRIPS